MQKYNTKHLNNKHSLQPINYANTDETLTYNIKNTSKRLHMK